MTEAISDSSSAHLETITRETGLAARSVAATARLLAEGGTVPFISRYRKEATGSLDEVQIQTIRDRMIQLAELDTRRTAILKSLDERGLLSPELRGKVLAAATMNALEDVFAPHRPKRQTRATKARDKGLEPLADWLLSNQDQDPGGEADRFVDAAKEVASAEEALAGARDIVAERVADDADLRGRARKVYQEEAVVSSRVMYGKDSDPGAAKFRDYFEWSEPLAKIPSHRMLAIRRGEKEAFLMMRISVPLERITAFAVAEWVKGAGEAAAQVREAAEDGCKRLLMPSMETEMRLLGKKSADETAIRVFADNLRELLLASPLGRKRILAIDPAFRTGCKTVVLDPQGRLLHHTVLHATAGSKHQLGEAAAELVGLVREYRVEAIAIGNGTASREAEAFVRGLKLPASIPLVVVNESGASVYSASEVAREEFPDEDVTVRGAVSIGRRLMDPLAELVKIDPKAIGVGQYQHDVDPRALKRSLDDVVESCVNAVGVELNTASKQLLSYVSGLNASLAENIVAFRNENGSFQSREQLKKVPRLGDKAFEQAAGFLRVARGHLRGGRARQRAGHDQRGRDLQDRTHVPSSPTFADARTHYCPPRLNVTVYSPVASTPTPSTIRGRKRPRIAAVTAAASNRPRGSDSIARASRTVPSGFTTMRSLTQPEMPARAALRRSSCACRMICSAELTNSPAIAPATITSGQPVPLPQTPSAATITATLPMASLREHSHTERTLESPSL